MTNNIINFYNEYLKHFSVSDASSVGWTDKDNQYTRFDKLFGIGITNGDKILDYGCGLGHLNTYMLENGFNGVNYFGIDINPNYVNVARSLYPDKQIFVGDIETIDERHRFDYVIGSGVFTIDITVYDVINKITLAYHLSNKGVAFNFLDKESGLEPLLTYDKNVMVESLSHIGNVEIIENYLGNEDFTIYIRK